MPKIGLSQMLAAHRNYDPVTQTLNPYTNGKKFARAVNYKTDITTTDSNDFYADNQLEEDQSGEFSSGSISLETAELGPEESVLVLGLKESIIEVGDTSIKEYLDAGDSTPELGFGVVEKWKVYGAIKWRGVVLPRISFNVPGDDVTTQGAEIDWQTDSIDGKILREQQPTQGKYLWRRKSELLNTEEEAAAYVRVLLNISGEANTKLQSLTIGSLVLTPPFEATTVMYTATTTNATNAITATPQDGTATVLITVNGESHVNGTAATWQEGENAVIIFVNNGGAQTQYTVNVTKVTE